MKNKVKRIGKAVVFRSSEGTTVFAPSQMHDEGLQRLVSSKRFINAKGDVRDVLKEGKCFVLRAHLFGALLNGKLFWYNVLDKEYRYYIKHDAQTAKDYSTGQIVGMEKEDICLIQEEKFYSFTIKTSPEKATIMATKKAATAKKTAVKKAAPAATKKAAAGKAKTNDGQPGKIEQIIALHKKGKSNAEIIEAGFNKTTVSIQVAKYKKENGKGK